MRIYSANLEPCFTKAGLFVIAIALASSCLLPSAEVVDSLPDEQNGGNGSSCSEGFTSCGDSCIDLKRDDSNCGQCGNACPGGQSCLSGQCCAAPAIGGSCSLPSCGCPTGQSCQPSTVSQSMACFDTGTLPTGADCRHGTCTGGNGCFADLCKAYCTQDSDCPLVAGVRKCDQTNWSDGSEISGVRVCERVCDPLNPRSPRSPLLACPVGFGCSPSEDGVSYCHVGGSGAVGASCSADADCAPGNYCTVASICRKFCSTNADCPTGTACYAFTPPQRAGSQTIGFCFEATDA